VKSPIRKQRDAVRFAEEDGMLMVGNLFGLRGVPFFRTCERFATMYSFLHLNRDCRGLQPLVLYLAI
jgi:hypothetical protein